MTKPPVSGHNTTSENLQSIGLKTWILKVYIHCEGCKKKVYKVLQSIDGVYKTVIDAREHKATVTGSVNGETLVQKLLKSGKHAEILPESFAVTADNPSGNSKKKKKQSNKQKDVVSTPDDDAENINDEKNASKGLTTEENVPDRADDDDNGNSNDNGNGNGNGKGGGGGKKKKNKKKKADKNDNIDNVTGSNEGLNLGPSMPQMVYSTPYDVAPYQNYYPTPAYGMSYSTSYPSTESSYYTPPVYGYAQSHPSVFYPVPPGPSGYRRSAFDDCDDEVGEGRLCIIM